MIRLAFVTAISALLIAPTAWGSDETKHSRMETEVCGRTRHFYREHGIRIMPEACDR